MIEELRVQIALTDTGEMLRPTNAAGPVGCISLKELHVEPDNRFSHFIVLHLTKSEIVNAHSVLMVTDFWVLEPPS